VRSRAPSLSNRTGADYLAYRIRKDQVAKLPASEIVAGAKIPNGKVNELERVLARTR
jgi:hypothetical protein